MREEKKYEVLPGVEIPDMKKIQEAASDFSVSDVGEVELKTVTLQPVARPITSAVSGEELSKLQQLGTKVAEAEAKSQAESRAKMDKIMQNVKAPESIRDLKESHISQVNEAKRKEIEENLKESDQQQAEEDAKNKAREERRQLQQRLLEESREKAAKEKAEKERLEKELTEKAEKEQAEKEQAEKTEAEKAAENANAEKADAEKERAEKPDTEKSDAEKSDVEKFDAEKSEAEKSDTPASAPESKPAEPEVKKTAKMVSNEEAFDDFKEFFEDDSN